MEMNYTVETDEDLNNLIRNLQSDGFEIWYRFAFNLCERAGVPRCRIWIDRQILYMVPTWVVGLCHTEKETDDERVLRLRVISCDPELQDYYAVMRHIDQDMPLP